MTIATGRAPARAIVLLRGTVQRLGLWAVTACALALAAAPAFAVIMPASPDSVLSPNARLYLTWHAPYGQPGATDRLTAACGDTAMKDTLYMCFDPGRDADHFQSFTGTVYFWAATGDSLDPHWLFGSGQGYRRLVCQLAPADVKGAEPAWPTAAFAASGYSMSSASGKLRFIAAGPAGEGGWPVKRGHVYVVSRILVPRPANKGACEHPICIEFASAMLGMGGGQLPEVRAGERFVSWNSKGGKVCGTMRSFATPEPWHPKKVLPPGWKEH